MRLIVHDDLAQAEIAAALLKETCYVSDTVLLETAWLLKSRYAMPRGRIAGLLRHFIGLPAISISDDSLVSWAISRFAVGADLADMMHLLSARQADGFVTFDRRLARQAGADSPVPIDTLTA